MPARRASSRRAAVSAASSSVDAARVASVVTRMPPAAYGAPAIRAANSSPRSPANTRWVCESTKPGITQRPAASIRSSAAAPARSIGDDATVLDDQRGVADEPERTLAERLVVGDEQADVVDDDRGHREGLAERGLGRRSAVAAVADDPLAADHDVADVGRRRRVDRRRGGVLGRRGPRGGRSRARAW